MNSRKAKTLSAFANTKSSNKLQFFIKLLLTTVFLAATSLAPAYAQNQNPQTNMSSEEIAAGLKSSGLPVANVESLPISDAKGTVILIPQVHQTPGSQAGDAINNNGEVAQDQIYKIESYLSGTDSVPLLMIEGELYGPLPQKAVDQIKQKIDAENNLKALRQKLAGAQSGQNANSQLETRVSQDLSQAISATNREIVLKGGAYRLKAEGSALNVYGAENPQTYQKSADIVRDYIYAQDRVAQLSGQNNSSALGNNVSANPITTTSPSSGIQGWISDATRLSQAATADGNTTEAALMTEFSSDLQQLMATEVQPVSSTPLPSRADNPYANISDPSVMQEKLAADEQNIQQTIVNQRNQETAVNFANMLTEQHQNIGMLQFGAQHKPGLIKELQKQGLSVLVVTPTQVAATESANTTATTTTTAPATTAAITSNTNSSNRLVQLLKLLQTIKSR